MHLPRCGCTTTSLTCEKVSCCLVRCQFKCSITTFALYHRLVSIAITTGHLRPKILGKSNYFQRMTRQTNHFFQSMNKIILIKHSTTCVTVVPFLFPILIMTTDNLIPAGCNVTGFDTYLSVNSFKFFTFWKSSMHSKCIEFKTSPFMAVTSRSFNESFIPLVANVVREKVKHWQDK